LVGALFVDKNIDNLEESKKSVIEFYEDMFHHELLDEVPSYIYEFYSKNTNDLP